MSKMIELLLFSVFSVAFVIWLSLGELLVILLQVVKRTNTPLLP